MHELEPLKRSVIVEESTWKRSQNTKKSCLNFSKRKNLIIVQYQITLLYCTWHVLPHLYLPAKITSVVTPRQDQLPDYANLQ